MLSKCRNLQPYAHFLSHPMRYPAPPPLSTHSLLLSSSCPMKHVFNLFAVNKLNLEKESDEIEGKRERGGEGRGRREVQKMNCLHARNMLMKNSFALFAVALEKRNVWLLCELHEQLCQYTDIYTQLYHLYIYYRYTICVQLCLRPLLTCLLFGTL